MDKKLRTIPLVFEKVDSINIEDTRFIKVKIKMMHLGLNLNNSIFTKEVVDAAIPTIFNTPILGFVEKSSDGEMDFSDHRDIIVIEKNGVKLVYKGIPYGTIPESCNPRYETEMCSDGIERTFLVVDGLIWSKIENSDIFTRDGIKKASMELDENSLTGEFDEEKHFVFSKFSFYGICALGENVVPAMTGASISTDFCVNIDGIKEKLNQFNNYIVKNKKGMKGENILKDELIKNIFSEFNLSKDDVTFKITDDMTEKDLREKLIKFTSESEPNKEIPIEVPVVFSTYKEKRDILNQALSDIIQRDEHEDLIYCVEYCICDFDDSYVYVLKDIYDNKEWSSLRGRMSYTLSEDGHTATINTESFEVMVTKWLTIEEDNKINEMRKNFESQQSEIERLQIFEKNTIKDKFEENVTKIFSKFDNELNKTPEFDILKKNYSDMTIEQIEDKCYAILGKKKANFSVNSNGVVNLKLENDHKDSIDDDGYGGLLSRKYNK